MKSVQEKNPKKTNTEIRKKKNIFTKVSHIHLQDKNLTKIPKHTPSKDLQVLYLYNNKITAIENLYFPNLTCLYLQNNAITKIENLQHLVSLKKLFIGHNKISVLEGLNSLEQLEELHIEKQDIPEGSSFCVDPRTVLALSESLRILNISHNKLCSLDYLRPLRNLVMIDASHNDLDDIKDVCQAVREWMYLREANFAGNPICKKHRYKDEIISNSYYLHNLDGKKISDITRKFIKQFEREKLVRASKQSINLTEVAEGMPGNYPSALKKAASISLLRQSSHLLPDDLSTFDEGDAVHIAWKTMPQRKPVLKTSQVKGPAGSLRKTVAINNFLQIHR
nr:unnamed protein product [Callosobruchus analis]